MKKSPRAVWNINLLLVVALSVLALAAFSVAYGSGNPAYEGHTSDEFAFTYVDVSTNCQSSSSTTCTVTCPAGTFLVAARCGTAVQFPTWTSLGRAVDEFTYSCEEPTHVVGTTLIVLATCMQGAHS